MVKPYDKNTVIDGTDIEPVLEAMDAGTPAIVVEAPPGAGKTFLTAFCLAHAMERRESILYVATSYEQIDTMCKKFKALFPGIKKEPIVFASNSKKVKENTRFAKNGVFLVDNYRDFNQAIERKHPVATVVAKLAQSMLRNDSSQPERMFRWMIIDEAWQVTDAMFAKIAPVAKGFILVGDMGQIKPIVKSNVTRWEDSIVGPHRPIPETLLARPHLEEHVLRRPMTKSRRLPERSAKIVQEIFYPNLPFRGVEEPRNLQPPEEVAPHHDAARAIAIACSTNPPAYIPVLVQGREQLKATDTGVLDSIISLTTALLEYPPKIHTSHGDNYVTDEDIVLIVSRNLERRYLGNNLLKTYPNITIATANKFQGSEKPIVIVLHPLSGKRNVEKFYSDSGRLCVMLSRHTHACFVVHRAGIVHTLENNIPNTPRAMGNTIDWAQRGWKANLDFAQWLDDHEKITFDCSVKRLDPPKTYEEPEELLA